MKKKINWKAFLLGINYWKLIGISFILTLIILFLLFLYLGIFYPAYLSLQDVNDTDNYYVGGFYYPRLDIILVKSNQTFIEVNDTTMDRLLLSMDMKMTYNHEKCHQNQYHEGRNLTGKLEYFNELECYFSEYVYFFKHI